MEFVETFACGSAAEGFPATGLLVGTFDAAHFLQRPSSNAHPGQREQRLDMDPCARLEMKITEYCCNEVDTRTQSDDMKCRGEPRRFIDPAAA